MSALTPEELEERLGDPADDANPHGFAAAVARDERDAFPDALCAELVRSGFHLNYLPVTWGGTLESFDRSLTLVRTAARRDVAIMPGTMFSIIAATCLQLHGSPGQQRRAAEILRAGGAVAFALTEAAHGSDLLTNEVRLADGVLSGEKWMVGLGLRCDAVYVVARTGERGPGAFTAVLLETAGLSADRLERVPAPRTGGMRGIDLATLRFHDTPVPPDALVGKGGEGLEAAVKAQQTVRLMSMAGSLGIADTAVRLALDFATGRRVGRAVLTEAPHSRRELGVATAALIAADAVALSAARGVHVVPEAFSVWAPAAKHVVAEACDDLIRRGAAVLATRSVLREGTPGGAGLFQKLRRDSDVVRVIDASTLANLASYAVQLPTLTEGTRRPDPDALRTVFTLDAPLPPYEPTRLDLFARGTDPVLTGVRDAVDAVAGHLGDARPAALRLSAAVGALGELTRAAREPGADPNALIDAAERYAWLHAAACCLHLWSANRGRSLYGTEPGSTGWLGAALGYLLARADGTDPRHHGGPVDSALDAALALRDDNRLFTALPVRLATPR
ncbi:acyl-CoA dehydrogenase family protein [Streptomyces sp. I4(2020)]|uniref:acyl-CoA dehydrogenase family protein n=1 Tax=Streptomyces sp. I4(2020) TaxID=2760981 RepID=UPI0018EE6151|nr:acyl-CoA dehydrogenase family protein [Streptomyces sp. I4(2020)]MBJ6629640.1 acyl-CoA dehydrogenase family protein [Streptomyces sp. I4(2020)]